MSICANHNLKKCYNYVHLAKHNYIYKKITIISLANKIMPFTIIFKKKLNEKQEVVL